MNRKERRSRAASNRSKDFVKDYVRHLPEVDPATQLAPGVYHRVLYHDDWCGIYKGLECNCKPDVQLFKEPNRS
jgi:hypothetical protein